MNQPTSPVVTCIQEANAILGEGPSWDSSTDTLYWVDIQRPAIFRFDPKRGQTGFWPMPEAVGFVVPTAAEGQLAFADADGFAFLHTVSGEIIRITDPEPDKADHRFNDGKVDSRGRIWAGTLDSRFKAATGSLYRLDPDGRANHMAGGFSCANGLGWSPDDRTMYFTDSMVRTIWAYDFDAVRGELGARRVFARLADDDGFPDGLAVDAEGFVWSAIWDGWRIIRYAPDGNIEREIRMPVQRPTSCMFGGEDFKTMFVTSACVELGRSALRNGPLAGSLFAVETGVAGVAEKPFAGFAS